MLDIIKDMSIMGILKYILVTDDNNVCFISDLLTTNHFDDHVQAYLVTRTNSITCNLFADIIRVPPGFVSRVPIMNMCYP